MLLAHGQMLELQIQTLSSIHTTLGHLPQQVAFTVQGQISEHPYSTSAHSHGQGSGVESTESSKPKAYDNAVVEKRHIKFCRRWQFRLWFTRHVWEMATMQTQNGWDIRLRTWNLRQDDSNIFWLCERGDLARAKKLIVTGQASPFDLRPDFPNTSLLHVRR